MKKEASSYSLDAISSLCKRRGFIFQSSEIYGGINGFWDYGPLGCELKRNIREAWWKNIVTGRENVVGLDASIIMHPRVWEASGHVGGFSDPMADCKDCKKRFKADQLCEEQGQTLIKTDSGFELPPDIKCGSCGSKNLTEPRAFDLMFKTFVGPVDDVPAQCAGGLIAHEQDGALRAGDVVGQVVLDPAASAHARACDDHHRPVAVVDGL